MSREKDSYFFIALRRKIEDEDFLPQCGHWMEKTDKGRSKRERHTSRSTNPHGEHLSARSRPMYRKKDTGKENEIGSGGDTRTGSTQPNNRRGFQQ